MISSNINIDLIPSENLPSTRSQNQAISSYQSNMKVQTIAIFVAAVFAGFAFASPVPEAAPAPAVDGVPCGCTNSCIIACGGKPDCICPLYCDPKYLCPTTTTVRETPSPTPSFPRGISCGCHNYCTLYGCGSSIPKDQCVCPQYCDPIYECKSTSTAPLPTPTFKCGCTNGCKIACGGKPGCICPEFCDPKYLCKTTV
ncbi:hypothetical protein L873DRAFT_788021 [Choiromyces venosus 120613-1]|uniref:Uncharacterized protein n=1 Tax=Choiromyces venosus 120613-1 TaxID=1336337 RepID=A0A3N4K7Y2_9PEZI|nr:hypothetical protein L873DRAFT_788021 [Choiromyces venosus 120613-1]